MSVSLLSWYVFVRLFTFIVSFCLTDLSVTPKTTNKQRAKHNSKKPQIQSLLKTSSDHGDSKKKKKTGLRKGGLQQHH